MAKPDFAQLQALKENFEKKFLRENFFSITKIFDENKPFLSDEENRSFNQVLEKYTGKQADQELKSKRNSREEYNRVHHSAVKTWTTTFGLFGKKEEKPKVEKTEEANINKPGSGN